MSADEFFYCKAQPEDVNEIKKIELACGLSSWSIRDYEREVNINPDFIVCKFQEKVIGFLLVRLITLQQLHNERKGMVLDNSDGKYIEAEILNIGVSKDFQRKNIGTNLLKLMLKKIESYKRYSIVLDVRISNTSAIEFYKSFNFKIIARRKNLYSNPNEDGYFMKLENM